MKTQILAKKPGNGVGARSHLPTSSRTSPDIVSGYSPDADLDESALHSDKYNLANIPISAKTQGNKQRNATYGLTSNLPIQAKLTIGKPNDKYEQEADRVAQQVVHQLNAPQMAQSNQEQIIQREVLPNGKEEDRLQMKPLIQRKAGEGRITATPGLESLIQQARGSGQPLPSLIRKPMEQALRCDFSDVKIHTDSRANLLNHSFQSRAFTTQQDIFFRQGAYKPGNSKGQDLIAHELTHVVQQNSNIAQSQILPFNPSLTEVAKTTRNPQPINTGDGIVVQRAPLENYTPYIQKTNNLIQAITVAGTVQQQAALNYLAEINTLNQEILTYQQQEEQPTPSGERESQTSEVIKRINMISSSAAAIEEVLRPNVQANDYSKVPSVIEFGNLTPEGGGTFAEAKILTKNAPKGSKAGIGEQAPIWKAAQASHAIKAAFVQGHLLNDNIGGPARSYNLTPITNTVATHFGIPSANQEHKNRVENDVKEAVEKDKKAVYYRVDASYDIHPRREKTKEYLKNSEDKKLPPKHRKIAKEKYNLNVYQEENFATKLVCKGWELQLQAGKWIKGNPLLEKGTQYEVVIDLKLPDPINTQNPILARRNSLDMQPVPLNKGRKKTNEFETANPMSYGNYSITSNLAWLTGYDPRSPKTEYSAYNPFRKFSKEKYHPYK